MTARRQFIKQLGLGGVMFGLNAVPWQSWYDDAEMTRITILHTNDVHSRIEPFPMDGSRNAGLGGAAKRAALIKKIRSEEKNVLLFDSGDIFQGTPYFNLYGGELEMKLMREMCYDAATMGNHDFDGGIEGFAKHLPAGGFDLLCANYRFENTPLQGKGKDYKVFKKGGIKIGVMGLGIELDGLVPKALYGETLYQDPIKEAERVARVLRYDEGCHYIICLSHLGYKYENNKVSDLVLAATTKEIDLILGGHTHTFLKEPTQVKNKAGRLTLVNQAGWAGIQLGRLDLFFERNKKGTCVNCKNLTIG